jgi:hypothetical protein
VVEMRVREDGPVAGEAQEATGEGGSETGQVVVPHLVDGHQQDEAGRPGRGRERGNGRGRAAEQADQGQPHDGQDPRFR